MKPHSPRPWTVSRRQDQIGADIQIADQRGELVAIASTLHKGAINAEDNARLIAAAPDLLEACLQLTDWIERKDYVFKELPEFVLEQAKEAIAKAQGKEVKT